MLGDQAEHNRKKQEHFQLHDSVQMSALVMLKVNVTQIKGHMNPQHSRMGSVIRPVDPFMESCWKGIQ
jgi:hypothetical protein